MKLSQGILMHLLAIVLTLTACEDEEKEKPSVYEVQLGMLAHTWILTDASKDGQSMEGYENFKLTLSGSPSARNFTYATFSRPDPSPWPSGGSWRFGSLVSTQLIRDGGTDEQIVMSYSATDTSLTLEFDFIGDGFANGRTDSSEGRWVFQFTKQ